MIHARMPAPAATVWERARPQRPALQAVAPVPGVLAGMRVLIVDGDPVHSALLALALEHFGVTHAVPAGSAGAALALLSAAAEPFALIVADLELPDMDGMLFLRRAAHWRPGRVALASALAPDGLAMLRRTVEQQGVPVAALLAKPIDLDAVAGLLAACGPGRAPASLAPALPQGHWSREELVHALATGQFEPFFQPLCALDSGRCTGAEILARWRHPRLGLLEADRFIACLEREGMLDALCETLLTRALRWTRRWERDGARLALALNASPSSVQQTGFSQRLAALCAEHGFAPGRLTLELTETALAGDDTALLQGAMRLREMGFKLAMDDFGAGYSSLQRLADLPFSELKIDRSFVNGAAASARQRAILASMCTLAQRLGMDCVAEGIEYPHELALLRELGCTVGQGYLFAAPMEGFDLAAWCRHGAGLAPGCASLSGPRPVDKPRGIA